MNKNHFIFVTLLAAMLWPVEGLAQNKKPFLDFCLDSYMEKNLCPEKICHLRCPKEEPNCVQICLPKECPAIKAEDCPLEYCQIMTDCAAQKICHYQMAGGLPECGDLAYAGQDVECCQGLVKRCGIEFIDGRCDMEGKNSVYNLPICIPCGDGICGQFEDRCNCPEDCKKDFKKPEPAKTEEKSSLGDTQLDLNC